MTILLNPKIISLEKLASQNTKLIWERKKRQENKRIIELPNLELYQEKLTKDKFIGRRLFICSTTKKDREQIYLGYVPVNPSSIEIAKEISEFIFSNRLKNISRELFEKRAQTGYLQLEQIGEYLKIPKEFYLDSF
jgi:hypothetical protein